MTTAHDYESKIAALLAKAEGTTNAHEAEAYMAKAEKLMLAHGIERANVEAKRPGTVQQEVVIERVYLKNGHGYAMAQIHIAFAVAPNFSCRALQSSMGDGSKMAWFVGHRSDVDEAVRLFNSLIAQSVPQAKHWWKTEGKPSRPWASDNDAYLARREFIFAFASGVRERLQETRRTVVEEAGTGTELVLVERTARVDSWIDSNLQVGKARGGNRNHGGYDASIAGKAAGREAVGQKSLR